MENFGSFLFKFGINIRKTIRLIESTDKKLINAELALLFYEACKNENILPRYTDCERRELPSQYGRPKKRNKIFNIGRRTILYKTFSYSFSILN